MIVSKTVVSAGLDMPSLYNMKGGLVVLVNILDHYGDRY